MVDIADPLGNIGSFRLNHMHPPFNNLKVRQAVQIALSQQDYMQALVGADEKLWKPCPSFFTPQNQGSGPLAMPSMLLRQA